MIRKSLRRGLGFGLPSGVITTLGLIIGLYASTQSKITIIAGILTIAIADSLSDALGMHMSEEAEKGHSIKEIWEATFATLFSKAGFALSFAAIFFLFQTRTAVAVSIAFGLISITLFSIKIAKKGHIFESIAKHLLLSLIVIALTHIVGTLIAKLMIP